MAKTTELDRLTVLYDTRDQAEVEWVVPYFLEDQLSQLQGKCFQSPNFLIGDASWYLQICPDGQLSRNRGWTSIGLCRMPCPGVHTVSIRFGIKGGGSKINDLEIESTYDENEEPDMQRFTRSSILSDVVKDTSSGGTMTVLCTARLLEGRHKISTDLTSQQTGLQVLSKRIDKLTLVGNWTDIKIKVGEREFDVDKLTLTTRSPVFAAMFEHKMAERMTGVVEVTDIDPDIFKDLLLYMYTDRFSHVTTSNVVGLYQAAHQYTVDELKEECRLRIVTGLSVDTVLDVITLAMTHDEGEMLQSATEFFDENVEKILGTERWKSFLKQNLQLANVLLIKIENALNI